MKTRFPTKLFLFALTAIYFPANADLVTDWNSAALDAIRAGKTTATNGGAQSCDFARCDF